MISLRSQHKDPRSSASNTIQRLFCFEGGRGKPLSYRAHTVILNYQEPVEKVESFPEGERGFFTERLTRQHGAEVVFAPKPNFRLGSKRARGGRAVVMEIL